MAEKLYRVGDTDWYILVDTDTKQIIGQYNKSQTQATVDQIELQIAEYPDPSIVEDDIQALITLVNNYAGATAERKARVLGLLNDMYFAYQGEPVMLERAELRARLEKLNAILAQMEG